MMKRFEIRGKIHIYASLILITGLFVFQAAGAVTAEPGAGDDPLVSQSYVDSKISALNTQLTALNAQVTALNTQITGQNNEINSLKQQIGNVQYPKFEILNAIEPGKIIIGGASTEIILRGGEATVLIGPNSAGGISNLISGKDIPSGEKVPLDQLLLVPRDDGRGIKITKTAWVMIKGKYTIQ